MSVKFIVFYYCTADPAVLKAHHEDEMAAARIEATAARFAEQFKARPYFTIGFDSHFAGIGFDAEHPCAHPDLWSKPTPQMPVQVPRSPERAGSKMRATAEKLYKEFYDAWPADIAQPRTSELMRVLQLDGKDMSNELLVYVEVERQAYIATSVSLTLPECFASDFVRAQRRAEGTFQPVSGETLIKYAVKGSLNG